MTDSTEADIVERLQDQFFTRMEHGIVVVDREIIRECVAEITKLRAERDAAARDMRERCAKVADGEAGLLLFTGARLASFEQATKLYYSEVELHDQAGTAIQVVADKIRALPDPSSVIATEGKTNG